MFVLAPSSSLGARARRPSSSHHQHQQQQYHHADRRRIRTRVHKEWAAQGERASAAASASAERPQQHQNQQRLTSASEFTRDALALLRHPAANPRAVAALLPPGALVPPGTSPLPSRLVAGFSVVESGPLAGVRGEAVLDACARRVLPGHLLRRCRVLSSLAVGGGRHLQRVALVAHSGEEARFDVEVVVVAGGDQEEEQDEGGADDETDPEGDPPLPPSLRGWRITRMTRDASGDDDFFSSSDSANASQPLRPAARVGPEAAILAQLSRLSRGDVAGASRWCSWARRLGSGAAWEQGLKQFRETLRRPEYHALLMVGGGAAGGGDQGAGATVSLGPAALPSQRRVLQSVRVSSGGPGGSSASEREYLWEMSMQDDGVWLVRSIAAVR